MADAKRCLSGRDRPPGHQAWNFRGFCQAAMPWVQTRVSARTVSLAMKSRSSTSLWGPCCSPRDAKNQIWSDIRFAPGRDPPKSMTADALFGKNASKQKFRRCTGGTSGTPEIGKPELGEPLLRLYREAIGREPAFAMAFRRGPQLFVPRGKRCQTCAGANQGLTDFWNPKE